MNCLPIGGTPAGDDQQQEAATAFIGHVKYLTGGCLGAEEHPLVKNMPPNSNQ